MKVTILNTRLKIRQFFSFLSYGIDDLYFNNTRQNPKEYRPRANFKHQWEIQQSNIDKISEEIKENVGGMRLKTDKKLEAKENRLGSETI